MSRIKRFLVLGLVLLAFSIKVFAQIPNGYYATAEGKTGAELKTALYNIIKDHTVISYDGLWDAFQYTDKKSNGKVWDMYSDIPGQTPPYEFVFVTNQCGNYNSEGDCYNREHSFPKSWFNDASPMYSDLFHLYPTDGYVNNRRSNYIFGEVENVTWTSLNGSMLGTTTASSTSITVFEPIDEYKGDFARTYFYMATRYENLIDTWASYATEAQNILDGTKYPAFKQWYIDLLIKWHEQDPVSQKEIDRNNIIYNDYQHNRNPFIDHPEYAVLIWTGSTSTITFTSSPITSATVGTQYTYNVTATGGNGSTLTISATTLPGWLTLTSTGNGTATLSGTPSADNVGNNSVTLTCTDGESTANQSFTINVVGSGTQTSSETFENIPTDSPSSYTSRSWTGDNNLTWQATNARTDQTINSKAICLKDASGSYVESPALTGGCSQISFKHQQKFSGSGGIITVYVNNQQFGTANVTTDVQTSTFTITGVSDNFTIKLESNGAARIAIDDLEWTSASGSTNSKPIISDVTVTPQSPVTKQTITVSANITDSDGNIIGAMLKWGYTSDNLSTTFDMQANGSEYSSPINAQDNPTQIYYQIVAIDNSEDTSYFNSSITVTQNQLPVIENITQTPSSPTSNDAVAVSAEVTDPEGRLGNVFLLWGTSENSLNNSDQMSGTSSTFTGQIPANQSGTTIYYKIKAFDAEGQIAYSNVNSYTVSPSTDIDIETTKSVSVYPNPFSSFIQIEYPFTSEYSYSVSNLIGQTLMARNGVKGNTRIDCSNLQNGIYMLTIKGGNGTIIRKMIKR
ncbi:MAG: hypothetical protein PWR03_1253 [Tenuifilum sp.]|jgi:endonuclease I|uniref:endonuclease n=1 Tax=Tenuifilum sp. TaxID=2760880 RepID=UPI0024AA7BE1|nr:endonuclease [Tenuifilum sp.]MDI3527070.1 hypothetical protein [Tenuifilum sp.]